MTNSDAGIHLCCITKICKQLKMKVRHQKMFVGTPSKKSECDVKYYQCKISLPEDSVVTLQYCVRCIFYSVACAVQYYLLMNDILVLTADFVVSLL